MSLKMKLTSTIAAFLLILGLTIMGVMAAPSATVNLGGSISFSATDVFAVVKGSVTGSAEANVQEGGVLNLETLNFSSETDATEEGAKWSNTNLTFDNLGSEIAITITIENKATDRALYVKVEETIGDIDNLTKSMTRNGNDYTGSILTLPASTGESTSVETIVLKMEVENPNISLAEGLSYSYEISLQDKTFLLNADNFEEISEQETLAYVLNDETMTASVGMIDVDKTKGDIKVPMYVKDGVKVYTVTSVPDNAFDGNTSITSISLPDTIIHVGSYAFRGCTSLDFAEYENGEYLGNTNNPYLALINTNCTTETFTINENCRVLGARAFQSNSYLKNIVVPESVIGIGDLVFAACTKLVTAQLPTRVEYFGRAIFQQSSSLTTTNIPNGVKELAYTFAVCTSLTKVGNGPTNITLPQGLEKIEIYSFYECSKLTGELVIPKSVTSIGSGAFYKCSGLTGKLELPEGLTSIGTHIFYGCSGFKGELVIPEGLTCISQSAFHDCSGLTSLKIPESVTEIKQFAFASCTSLPSIEIPESVTKIENNIFQNCSGLKGELVIPESVISIGSQAFVNCSGLTSVTIPDSVTEIGNEVFYGCSNLASVRVEATAVPALGGDVFKHCPSGLIIEVPNASLSLYEADAKWSEYTLRGYTE